MKSDFVRKFSSELDNFVKLFKCLSKPFGKIDCCTQYWLWQRMV